MGRPFHYRYEVVRILMEDDEGSGHWTMWRWGMNADRQPYPDDGPRVDNAQHYLTNLERVAPGVWKDNVAQHYDPLYYRLIDVGEQKDLFS
ncbi:hypothetical protein D3C87_1423270 [compost metagenome]